MFEYIIDNILARGFLACMEWFGTFGNVLGNFVPVLLGLFTVATTFRFVLFPIMSGRAISAGSDKANSRKVTGKEASTDTSSSRKG